MPQMLSPMVWMKVVVFKRFSVLSHSCFCLAALLHGATATFLLLRVQELCDSRGGRPGLSVLTSLLVSVDVTLY